MRRTYTSFIIIFLLSIAGAKNVYGQGNYTGQNMNYKVMTKVLVPGIKLEADLSTLSQTQYTQESDYFDDSGRRIQTIGVRSSPAGYDVVKEITYDALGRPSTSYLPMTHTGTDGRYKSGILTSGSGYSGSPHALFFNSGANGVPVDSKPYSITYFETAPTGRVVEQGGVGAAWQKNTSDPLESHTATILYGTNTANEVMAWSVTGEGQSSLLAGQYYPATMLTKVTTTSMVAEQGNAHDNEYITKIEYQDVYGRTVMSKVKADGSNWAETHYVFDKYGRLRFILTPEFIKALGSVSNPTFNGVPAGYTLLSSNTTFTSSVSSKYVYASGVTVKVQAPGSGSISLLNGTHIMPQQSSNSISLLADLTYQFIYDNEGRKIGDKSPGADWTMYVYDKRDRLALSQNGNQRLSNKWSFTKYDKQNRAVLSGETVIAKPWDSVANKVKLSAEYETRGGSYHGYTNNTYPSVTDLNSYILVNYYDDYSFKSYITGTAFDYKASEISGGLPATEFTRVAGSLTASKMKTIGADTWLWTVSYFDDKLRSIQTISGNHLSGTDISSKTYNFVGWTLSKRQTHSSSITSYTALEEYTYDLMGRQMSTSHKKGDSPAILLSKSTVNEAGFVTKRQYHSTDNGANFFITNNLTKNIKGWPKTSYFETAQWGTFLELDHNYNDVSGTPTAKQRYDGAMSMTSWYHDFGISPNSYEMQYDPMGRLSSARSYGPIDDSYNESMTYDLNGNIKTLSRNSGRYTAVQSDNLVYDYGTTVSNQLKSVTDNATTNASLGFNDGNKSGNDYTYDASGNLTSDKNKGITSITYNLLNLPSRIDFSNSTYVTYLYDATGQKLSQDYRNASGSIDKRDYVGEILYVNGQLAMASHPEGRLIPSQNQNLINNATAGTTAGFSPSLTTLAVETISSQTYVSATYNSSAFPGPIDSYYRGIRSISNVSTNGLGAFDVVPGETYLFRVLGYQQTGTTAKPFVTDFSSYFVPGNALPIGSASEGWTSIEFTPPPGVTSVFLGVAWDGAALNDKFYVNHVSFYNREWEYEYYTTDWLGNIRAVMQTKPSTITYNATMETENYSTESSLFQNMSASNILINPTANKTTGGNEVYKVNSVNRIGPAKSLKVFQNDHIQLKVSAYFATPPGSFGQVAGGVMASAVVSALTSGQGQAFVDGVTTAYNNTGSNGNFTLGSYQGTSYPSAFLNYILFDENYVPITAKSIPLANTPNVIQTISFNSIQVWKQGYLYAYLSYDNTNSGYDVYFDEFQITHQESEYVQLNDYYPFGLLSYSWTRDAELDNRLRFQGKELDPNTGYEDFLARQYDPAIGRFISSDPQNQFASGYAGFGNNPNTSVDPDGEFVQLIIGAVIGGTFNWIAHGAEFNKDGLKAFGVGALAGALSAGIGAGVNVAMAGGSFGAGFVGAATTSVATATGTATAQIASTGFLAGAASAGAAGAASGLISGTGNALIAGKSFGDALRTGLKSAASDAFAGGVSGGIIGGIDARTKGVGFWNGKGVLDVSNGACAEMPEALQQKLKDNPRIVGKYVGSYEHANVYESSTMGEGQLSSGITLPASGGKSQIIVGTKSFTGLSGEVPTGGDLKLYRDMDLIKHEFGHVLQIDQLGGALFLSEVGAPSLGSATQGKIDKSWKHRNFWTEVWANQLSYSYHQQNYGLVDKWDFKYYPLKWRNPSDADIVSAIIRRLHH